MIIMIVYHFKQRIILLEQKQDTMFEIINNIVKQIKNMQINLTYLGENQNRGYTNNENMLSFSSGINHPIKTFDVMFNDAAEPFSKPVVSEMDLSEEDVEENTIDNDEESDDDTEEDADADTDDDVESVEEESSDEEDSSDEEKEDEKTKKNIKVVSVDIEDTKPDDLGILEFTEINSSLENINELREEDIVIHKIHNINDESEHESSKDNKDIYKKMNLSTLKATVIEKGLSTDPSKLKKQELIKLLESSE